MRNDFGRQLGADHIDLIVTAALQWNVLPVEGHADPTTSGQIVATAAGLELREQNRAAIAALSERGRTRLVDRTIPPLYAFTPVDHLPSPVAVIKAAQAANTLCAPSPRWERSPARRLLQAVIAAACRRLEGYEAAPWAWTRESGADHPAAPPLGVTVAWRPSLPGIHWVPGHDAHEHWTVAPVVIITTEAAVLVPADLPERTGVILLAPHEQSPDDVWQAVTALDLPASVMFWPQSRARLTRLVTPPALAMEGAR